LGNKIDSKNPRPYPKNWVKEVITLKKATIKFLFLNKESKKSNRKYNP
jgi:type IV secretory pathway component VirB8